MAKLKKFPKRPKGKLSLDREIKYTQKYLEVANHNAGLKSSINGLSTEREKLKSIRSEAKENSMKGKKTNKKV
jgi:hypothetical protein